VISDHPYNAEYLRLPTPIEVLWTLRQIFKFCALAAAGMARRRTWLPVTAGPALLVRRPDDGRLTTEAGTRSWSPDQQRDPCHRLRVGLAPAD
jgi:hypothetical protein